MTLEVEQYSRNHHLTNYCHLPLIQYSPLATSPNNLLANPKLPTTNTNFTRTMVAASVVLCEGGGFTASVSTSASSTQHYPLSVHSAWSKSSGRLYDYDRRSNLEPHFRFSNAFVQGNTTYIAYNDANLGRVKHTTHIILSSPGGGVL